MTLTPRAKIIFFCMITVFVLACERNQDPNGSVKVGAPLIEGTWELIKSTTIQGNDTTIVDYTLGLRFIKVINKTHFAFLNHDLNMGQDSTASFVSGGGKYELVGNKYKEHLEFCNYREWEGHDFEFNVEIQNDTFTQRGIEKVEGLGVDRLIIEVYKRTSE